MPSPDHIATDQEEDTAFDFKIKLFQIVLCVTGTLGGLNKGRQNSASTHVLTNIIFL